MPVEGSGGLWFVYELPTHRLQDLLSALTRSAGSRQGAQELSLELTSGEMPLRVSGCFFLFLSVGQAFHLAQTPFLRLESVDRLETFCTLISDTNALFGCCVR